MSRVLMVVGDFVEDYEAMVPYQTLLTVGCHVDTVCPGKMPGETVATAVHDFEGYQTYTEKLGHAFGITASFDEANAGNYDGLLLPGGRAPEYLRLDQRVLQLVRQFVDQTKPIGAICHGIQILTAAGVVSGRRISCYPAVAPEVAAVGAEYVIPSKSFDNAEVDGPFVTAPAWPAHPAFLKAFLKLLAK